MPPPASSRPRRFFSWRMLARAALCLTIAYAVVVAALLAWEDRLVFHPVPACRRWADPPPACAAQDVELQTAEGTRIHARWFPRVGARRAVLVCHSRAGNLSRELRASELAGWHEVVEASVLIFDYPGYGRSEGAPSEGGCYSAAEAAYDWLTETRSVAADQVILYGRSLGTAVAVELATRRAHRALVLVSPLTSLPDVALGQFPLLPARQLMRNRFDSLSRIARCARPVFIVHGTRDSLVPFSQGEKLYAAANEPKRFLAVEGARHGNCVTGSFFTALRSFLNEQGAQQE